MKRCIMYHVSSTLHRPFYTSHHIHTCDIISQYLQTPISKRWVICYLQFQNNYLLAALKKCRVVTTVPMQIPKTILEMMVV